MNLSVHELRKRHPKFIFHAYNFGLTDKGLRLSFHFEIEPAIHFYPEVIINGITRGQVEKVGKDSLNNFVFHLGLMEIPSYWKAACPGEIAIKAGDLDVYQLDWWQDLLKKGLGEFFYGNSIDFTGKDFVTVKAENGFSDSPKIFRKNLKDDKYLVPIGGGKDSSVACELLRKSGKEIVPFCLNPIDASLKIIEFNKFNKPVTVKREIDPKLLDLNRNGYLNGHTPFSAYLAFLSALVSVLFDIKTTLVSNARSSNEGNTLFKNEEINHQYSKSYRFERRFRDYSKKYLAPGLDFISFLRPFYELQIW